MEEQHMKDADKGKPEDPGTITVVVHYQAKDAKNSFSPSASVEEVLDWALAFKEFGIDPAMVNEFSLERHNVKEELALGDHLGKLATGAKVIEFDLVRGDIANGAA
jgi:hypothetical protein